MEFTSFEEALKVCMTAEPGSEAQDAALTYCLHHAPPELKERLHGAFAQFQAKKQGGCGCGHDHCDHE